MLRVDVAWQPTAVSSLKLWLDADDASSFTFSSGTIVSQWADRSGNGVHVSQGTTANQPTRSGTLNGRKTLIFDGSNDGLKSANGALAINPITAFIVCKSTTTSRVMHGVAHTVTHNSPWFRWVHYHSPTNSTSISQRVNGTESIGANGTVVTSGHATYYLDSTAGDTYVNSVRKINAAGATITYPNSTPYVLCMNVLGGENMVGEVAEVMIYGKQLSADEHAQVAAYILAKWGI